MKKKIKTPRKTLLKNIGRLDTGFEKWAYEKDPTIEIPASKEKWGGYLLSLYQEYLSDSYDAQRK